MECNRFVDEKIGGTDGPEFRDHRAGCPGCARDLEELGEVRRLYHEASVERYPGVILCSGRRWRGAWLFATAAAGLMLAVLVVLLGSPPQGPAMSEVEAVPFFRVHLEPWGSEVHLCRAFDDAWQQLEMLERRR
jgi:hypothetical protein